MTDWNRIETVDVRWEHRDPTGEGAGVTVSADHAESWRFHAYADAPTLGCPMQVNGHGYPSLEQAKNVGMTAMRLLQQLVALQVYSEDG